MITTAAPMIPGASPVPGAPDTREGGNRRRRGRRGRGGDRADRPQGQDGEPSSTFEATDEGGPSVADVVGLVADAAPAPETAAPVAREPRPPKAPREPRPPREARPPREQPVTAPLELADVGAPAPAAADAVPQASWTAEPAPLAPPIPEVPPLPQVQLPSEPVVPPTRAHARPAPAPVPVPPVQLALPADSGLELVETRHPAPSETFVDEVAQRPKRVRPPRPEIVSEPLEIVETRKDAPPPA